jgi:conjugal transfer mating pair stabilization protein TraN
MGKEVLGTMRKQLVFISLILVNLLSFKLTDNSFAACDEQDLYCSIPGGTRVINGVDVKRDCWQYKYKMDCARNSKNDCNKINHNDCAMVAEDCISNEEEGGLKYCGNLKRKFACEREISWEEERSELVKEGDNVDGKDLLCASLCLDGNCDAVKKANMEEDKDMAQAVAMLNALKDAKKGIVGDDLINVFKGESEHCDKKFADYTNCCSKMYGWGKVVGAGCSAEAKNLAKKRNERKCVEIGRFCKTKFLGECMIKRTTFCCYDSIIAKIINQEAKKQLGRNNGDAENPSCSGLIKEDLENIDLSNVDFTEFYNEIIVPNLNIPDIHIDAKSNAQAADDIAKRAANMPAERKGFSNKIDNVENGNE